MALHATQNGYVESPFGISHRSPLSFFLCLAKNNGGTLCVVLSYFAIYIIIIANGHGTPYVMDNNESFSAITHAANLWNFDFFKSFGLADDAASPFPAAHPMVHTHQGDFPRLYSFLLYALGARALETQIWITTFTIGLASALLAKSFFRRVAGDLFATIATLMLISDYILFAQWQVNTYRVWHGFFLFASLTCVHGLSDWKRSYWMAATFILYACLLYWELVFAAFVAVTAGAYTVWTYRRAPRLIAIAGVTQTTAAIFGLGILSLQLILYLGWQDFLFDLKVIYLARNNAAALGITPDALREFYATKHVLFWPNFQDETQYSGLAQILYSIFVYLFQIETPLFIFVALSVACAAIIASRRFPNASDATITAKEDLAATLMLVPPIFALLFFLIFDSGTIEGQRPSFTAVEKLPTFLTVCIAVAVAIGIRRITAVISLNGAPPDIRRCAIASTYIFGFCAFALMQGFLYDQSQRALWLGLLTPYTGLTAKFVIGTAALVGTLVILAGTPSMLGRWRNVPAALVPFLVSGVVGYLFVYKLSAGYLYTGYLYRLCPLVIFHVEAFLALAPFVAIATAATFFDRVYNIHFKPLAASIPIVSGSLLFVFIVGHWAFVQYQYFHVLPPNRFSFATTLSSMKVDGIVSDTYGAPFGFIAKTWAYMDPNLGDPNISPQNRSEWQDDYLWFADGKTNKKYRRPEVFVCFRQFSSYVTLIDATRVAPYKIPRCSNLKNFSGRQDENNFPVFKLVARDEVDNLWAIYRLQWHKHDDPAG